MSCYDAVLELRVVLFFCEARPRLVDSTVSLIRLDSTRRGATLVYSAGSKRVLISSYAPWMVSGNRRGAVGEAG